MTEPRLGTFWSQLSWEIWDGHGCGNLYGSYWKNTMTFDKTNHWYTLQKCVNKKNGRPAMDGFDHPFLGSHSGWNYCGPYWTLLDIGSKLRGVSGYPMVNPCKPCLRMDMSGWFSFIHQSEIRRSSRWFPQSEPPFQWRLSEVVPSHTHTMPSYVCWLSVDPFRKHLARNHLPLYNPREMYIRHTHTCILTIRVRYLLFTQQFY